MKTVAERIGAYAVDLNSADLDANVRNCAKRIFLDSLACGLGGLTSEPVRIVRDKKWTGVVHVAKILIH
jgi:2-methylcitrate dehydratase PrpD